MVRGRGARPRRKSAKTNYYLGTAIDLCACNACVLAQPWRSQIRAKRWQGSNSRIVDAPQPEVKP